MASMFVNAMTDLWNSAGTTYTAIKMNVTNAASSATSKLIDLQIGAVSKFSVDKNGAVVAASSLSTAGAVLPTIDDGAALGSTTFRWSDLYGASGFTLNLASSNWVATHSSGILTVGTGDLRVTTAGTNAASVVTVGGTQTLTSKTLTTPTLTLKQSAAPTPTTEGDIQWDTDNNQIVIGNGATATRFSGLWEHIETFSGEDFSGGIQFLNLSAYRRLRVYGYVYVGGDGENVLFRTSTNNGSSFSSSASDYSYQNLAGSTSTASAGSSSAASYILIGFAVGSDTEERLVFDFIIDEFNQAAYMYAHGVCYQVTDVPAQVVRLIGGRRLSTSARDAFALIAETSGTISGFVTLEGIRG